MKKFIKTLAIVIFSFGLIFGFNLVMSTTKASASINDNVGNQIMTVGVSSERPDAYNVVAAVMPTFTMSESSLPDSFSGTDSSSDATSSTDITLTISTNDRSGWSVWSTNENVGLISTTANHNITSIGKSSSLGYGLSTLIIGDQEIATSTSPANNLTFVTHQLVNKLGTITPPKDYTGIITLIGAGNF